ncbi:Fe2+-dependent dioxygenase [Sphingomonadales bacterium 56]|uniref:Fe2+-dependent dioxygenase n=1 Tax=unclassified Sphingobium TaxID=2611147 RepID=UPI001919A9A4|nr:MULTISPECIES: Fe2+-dependent dioxygenase [unclassified Sphingobium]MBY2929164.1 Fe2+-dependent dioxygenase [Sphingomonadales bacterium 56]MBY2958924.1 Fe2+-dependent dioxygenase [Sphingomonadales bacterium 58]CAD7338064.1 PKHD-type hydroxylase [Sphingobium sp. S8]CAD7338930.1 PKHD-type hydroxylase [Sphingobium sp. S6]
MLTVIPDLLDAAHVERIRVLIGQAQWVDGNVTSGHQSALAKRNMQLPDDAPEAQQAGQIVLEALGRSPLFIAAALPLKIFPPLFNSYEGGQAFGVHVDNAVRVQAGTGFRVRSDLSITVFLEDPQSYDGGELTIETNFGVQQVKLPAGHAVLYPSSSLHRVEPVTRGRRTASFFWIQSMVRDDAARQMMFDLDSSIQALAVDLGHDNAQVIRLTGVYHNLLRRWADA